MKRIMTHPYTGVWIGIMVILGWAISLAFNLSRTVVWEQPLTYVWVLVQAHLFTGLFITAHDAMHGAVAPKRAKLNHLIGKVATFLFVFNSYKALRPKHYAHHRHAGTQGDPDFHRGNPHFLSWYYHFLKEYFSLPQIIAAAVAFNVAHYAFGIPEANLILYWVIPSLLSTLQLFYFGTFLPHMGEHDNVHHASSQGRNHLWAFMSCYFFGYHYEHHDSPMTPWWRLWEVKEQYEGDSLTS